MNQEKIGQIIKEIRKKTNLTQMAFAAKYGVTYQAVSKWENGKNIPDIALIKQISKDFNIDLDDFLYGKITPTKKKSHAKKILLILTIAIIILLSIIIILLLTHDKDFEFKTLTSNCNEFTISGSIAYNTKKSSIYISEIDYCGGSDTTNYQKIECNLYESSNNIENKISSYSYEEEVPLTLEDFLKKVEFNIDNYTRTCKEYSNNSLYLVINATDKNNKVTSYKVPLSLDKSCTE